jgi:glucose 1-dehydrogenase
VRALVAEPGVAGSVRVEEARPVHEEPGEVLLRVLEVGVCGTDREIADGHFGVAPEGEDRLVLGHEVLAVVERSAHGLERGRLVTATVRRSCGGCFACAEGSPDACRTGRYRERGITRLDGFARELVAEDPAQVVPVPAAVGRVGVLAEPASVCARALRHARAIGGREPWRLGRALVLGAGALGTLVTLLLRLEDVEVVVASLEGRSELVTALGAEYTSTARTDLDDLGAFDLVVEAAGSADLAVAAIGLLARGGVACVLGLDGRDRDVAIPGRVLAHDLVLENRVVFGSVNAHRRDWVAAVAALDLARSRFPGVLEQFAGFRVPLERFGEAFEHRGGKATLVLDEIGS